MKDTHTQARRLLNQRIIHVSEGLVFLTDLPDIPMIGETVEAIKAQLEDGDETIDISEVTPDWLMEVMEG